jgi:hypothetical protein
VALLILLPILYLASYGLLLVDEQITPDQMSGGELIIIPPFPKACYREEYAVGGEGVRLFFVPANRLHRMLDRVLPLD